MEMGREGIDRNENFLLQALRQTDVRQKHRLMPPPSGRRHNNTSR